MSVQNILQINTLLYRVEKSGLGFWKLIHDVAVVPRNSSLICQRLIVFWIKEG